MAKSKKNKGKIKSGTRHIGIQHKFTPIELSEKGNLLAEAVGRKKALEDAKKAATSDYTSKINQENATINMLSTSISNKSEMRNVETIMILDFDNTQRLYMVGKKVVKTEPLQKEDYQLEIEDTIASLPKDTKKGKKENDIEEQE